VKLVKYFVVQTVQGRRHYFSFIVIAYLKQVSCIFKNFFLLFYFSFAILSHILNVESFVVLILSIVTG
jgi:hypothetical protein